MLLIFNRFNLLLFICLLNLVFAVSLLAQNNDLKYKRISIEQGLSQTTVYCIFQDAKGFMWFGTRDGLNKYDGYEFTVYKHERADSNSLSNNSVRAICEDASGTLWIGTEGGLNRFDHSTEKFIHFKNNPEDPNSISHNNIRTILTNQSGTLWIGTAGGGINKMDSSNSTFTSYQNDPGNPNSLSGDLIYTMCENKKGMLWIGTVGGGLNLFDPKTESFKHYKNDPGNPKSLSDNSVNTVFEDSNKTLWVGTRNGGLNKFIPSDDHFIQYKKNPSDLNTLIHNNVNAICEGEPGILWIGTYGGGISRMSSEGVHKGIFRNYQHDPNDPYSLGHNLIRSIYKDQSGIIWIGTSEAGINKYDRKKRKFSLIERKNDVPNSLSAPSVSSIYKDKKDILWVGTYGGGLNRALYPSNALTEQDKMGSPSPGFQHFRHDPNDPKSLGHDVVYSIYEDRSGMMWLGTLDSGLHQFLPDSDLSKTAIEKNGAFTKYIHDPNNPKSLSNDRVMSIYEDANEAGQILWIGTYGGLNRFDRTNGTFTHFRHDPADATSLSDDRVNTIYEDQSDNLWIGTRRGGLNKFDRKSNVFIRYQQTDHPNSLSHNEINAIHESRKEAGVLWIGTLGGLNKFMVKQETFIHYGEQEGLVNTGITGILEDDQGQLWISTLNGVSKFDPQKENFKNYDVDDGLQSNEFNLGAYYKSNDGKMYFGGINGLNTFYPDSIKESQHIPPILITAFKTFDKIVKKDIPPNDEITLSYKDKYLTFEFVALDFSNSDKNQYAYKMEGFDEEWIYAGTRRLATYTNLDPGSYTFNVKGSNSDGVWNEVGTSITILITPPWWETWWAYALYAFLLAGSIYAYLQYKIRIQAKELAIERRTSEHLLRVNQSYSRFVPKEFFKVLGRENILDVHLGNQIEKEVTVLFSDIRSYTTLSESMTVKKNFRFLNGYLRRVIPVINSNNGMVQQFLGDGIMALFLDRPDDAIKAAIAYQKMLTKYNEGRIRKGRVPISVGIGMNTGSLMLGIIGNEKRMSANVVSDAVNTGSRMEGLTKYFGVSVLVSEDSFEKLENSQQFNYRYLGKVLVKGKKNALKVYDFFDGDSEDIVKLKIKTKADFEMGLWQYYNKNFTGAIMLYEKVLQVNPTDFAAKLYHRKVGTLIVQGIEKDWTGVEVMTEK